jgi:hypothetical protein
MATLTLKEFIEQTNDGRTFTVEFVKRGDGSLRVMNCRRGVKKGVKGVGMAYNPADYALLNVYDMQKMDPNAAHNQGKTQDEMEKGAFRMVNLEQLVALRMGGKKYTWDNAEKVFNEA